MSIYLPFSSSISQKDGIQSGKEEYPTKNQIAVPMNGERPLLSQSHPLYSSNTSLSPTLLHSYNPSDLSQTTAHIQGKIHVYSNTDASKKIFRLNQVHSPLGSGTTNIPSPVSNSDGQSIPTLNRPSNEHMIQSSSDNYKSIQQSHPSQVINHVPTTNIDHTIMNATPNYMYPFKSLNVNSQIDDNHASGNNGSSIKNEQNQYYSPIQVESQMSHHYDTTHVKKSVSELSDISHFEELLQDFSKSFTLMKQNFVRDLAIADNKRTIRVEISPMKVKTSKRKNRTDLSSRKASVTSPSRTISSPSKTVIAKFKSPLQSVKSHSVNIKSPSPITSARKSLASPMRKPSPRRTIFSPKKEAKTKRVSSPRTLSPRPASRKLVQRANSPNPSISSRAQSPRPISPRAVLRRVHSPSIRSFRQSSVDDVKIPEPNLRKSSSGFSISLDFSNSRKNSPTPESQKKSLLSSPLNQGSLTIQMSKSKNQVLSKGNENIVPVRSDASISQIESPVTPHEMQLNLVHQPTTTQDTNNSSTSHSSNQSPISPMNALRQEVLSKLLTENHSRINPSLIKEQLSISIASDLQAQYCQKFEGQQRLYMKAKRLRERGVQGNDEYSKQCLVRALEIYTSLHDEGGISLTSKLLAKHDENVAVKDES